MKESDIEAILQLHSEGKLSTPEAAGKLKNLSYEDIGYARVDHARASRQGFPEVIFGQGKTQKQILGIFEKLIERVAECFDYHARTRKFTARFAIFLPMPNGTNRRK